MVLANLFAVAWSVQSCGSYNFAMSMCCDGALFSKTGIINPACCGTQIYSQASSICCNHKVVPRTGHNSVCCGKKMVDLSVSLCCAGEARPKLSTHAACCGNRQYDTTAFDCCAKVVQPRSLQTPCLVELAAKHNAGHALLPTLNLMASTGVVVALITFFVC